MTTRRNLLLLTAATAAVAQTAVPSDDPARILYDACLKEEAAGRVDRAKLLALTLASTYPETAPAALAKTEIAAIYLFLEARAQAAARQDRAAYTTFRTVWTAYPESPLAKLAQDDAKSLQTPARR